MIFLRVIRMLMISFFTILSGLILTLTFWLPNRGLYYFVSHRLWGPGLLWSAGARVGISGLEHIKDMPPSIFYANHRSYFDIPALMKAIPVPLYFIAKIELRKVPFLGWAMRAVGMIFVDRMNPEKAKISLQKAGEAMRSGKNIVAYPEGTRSSTTTMIPFKKGIFALALQEGISLVPVAIMGTEKIQPRQGKFGRSHIRIHIAPPILPEEFQGLTLRELSALAQQRLRETLETREKSPVPSRAK